MRSRSQRLSSPAFLLAVAAAWLDFMSFHMYLSLSAFIESLGASSLLIGTTVGAAHLVRVFLGPYIGRLADRTGHRALLIAGSGLQTFACVLYMTVSEAGAWLVAIRMFHGIAATLMFCTIDAYVVTTIPPDRRSQGMSVYTAIAFAAIAAGSVLGEQVLRHLDSDWFFLISAVISALAMPFAACIRRQPVAVDERPLFAALPFRLLYPVCLLFSLFSFVTVAVTTFMATFVSLLPAGQSGALGLFFAVRILVCIAVKLTLGSLADRRGTQLPLVVGMLAEAVSLLILASTQSTGHLVLAAILSGVGWGLAFPQFFALIIQRTPAGETGAALAVLTSFGFLGEFLGSGAWGFVVDTWSHRATFALGGVLLVLAATAGVQRVHRTAARTLAASGNPASGPS